MKHASIECVRRQTNDCSRGRAFPTIKLLSPLGREYFGYLRAELTAHWSEFEKPENANQKLLVTETLNRKDKLRWSDLHAVKKILISVLPEEPAVPIATRKQPTMG